jgi:NDP-sugar pyrophosphorylase family protein
VKTVILAGGLGTRLKPFTEIIPKPLLPLGDKSILEHQILGFRNSGCSDVYVATNYMAELVEAFVGDGSRFGLRVHVSRERKPLGTAGPLKLLENELKEPFLVINGDIITKLDFRKLYDFGCSQKSCLTVGTKIITTPFRFGNVIVQDDAIVSVEEKPDFKLEIVAGVYCMKPEVFDYIPPDTYFGVDSLIRNLLAGNQRVSRFLIEDYWLDIGQVEDYSKARDLYAQNFDALAGPQS